MIHLELWGHWKDQDPASPLEYLGSYCPRDTTSDTLAVNVPADKSVTQVRVSVRPNPEGS